MQGPLDPAAGLVLVGYRGTGKSTVGRLVADLLGRPFADADHVLQARAGRPIAAIFATEGEPVFRDLEEGTIAELVSQPGWVLATGGGAVLRPATRERLLRYGLVVWLRAHPAEIARRLCRDAANDRPALTGLGTLGEIESVLTAREPLYRAASHLALDTDDESESHVAERIAAAFESRCLRPDGSPA